MDITPDTVALITGANGGIGMAIARALHGAGAKIIVTGRRADALEPIAKETGARVILADLARREDVERMHAEAGAVDVAACSCRCACWPAPSRSSSSASCFCANTGDSPKHQAAIARINATGSRLGYRQSHASPCQQSIRASLCVRSHTTSSVAPMARGASQAIARHSLLRLAPPPS